jgi:hypothetical protein
MMYYCKMTLPEKKDLMKWVEEYGVKLAFNLQMEKEDSKKEFSVPLLGETGFMFSLKINGKNFDPSGLEITMVTPEQFKTLLKLSIL